MDVPHFPFLLLLLLLLCFLALSHGRTLPLIIPVSKDSVANQYLATLHHGSPVTPTHLAVDLGAPSLWMACGPSTSARSVPARSIHCFTAAGANARSGVSGAACQVLAANRFGGSEGNALLVEDTLAVSSFDRSTAAEMVALHSCAPRFLLKGLAESAKGVLGLGRNHISLPAQIATELGFQRRFSVCLSSTGGVVVPDGGSVYGSEIWNSLTYTPILTTPHSPEYFINVKSMKVGGKRVDLNKSWVGGGTRLSTVVPYTALQRGVLESVTAAFKAAAREWKEVGPVAPFELCFGRAAGGEVPEIELVLQSEMVGWKMKGRNSMVEVGDGVWCLAFVDGGLKPENAVVLGGYQLEEVVLDFDLGTSMLGFSSSLLQRNTSCSHFSPEHSRVIWGTPN